MIEVTNVSRPEFEAAVRGMRNSWDSHDKSDSKSVLEYVKLTNGLEITNILDLEKSGYVIGENDLKLMKKLVRAGSDHAKFMRQITLSLDINGPLYWWKQFDTYKIGTTANSESTMHTINRTGFLDELGCWRKEMFSFDFDFIKESYLAEDVDYIFNVLEDLRVRYNQTKNKDYWDLLIALLPSGFNQKRTVTLNYAVLSSIYHSRKSHKLKDWHEFCDWIETLPYSELITGKVVNE